MKQLVVVVCAWLLFLHVSAQNGAPIGVTYYPKLELPDYVDSSYYEQSIPFIGLYRPQNEPGNHTEYYLEQGIGRKYFSTSQIQGLESYGFGVVQLPSQKRIYRINSLGVLPAWEFTSTPDTFSDLQVWTTEYHPELGVHTFIERRLNQAVADMHILDSTFHQLYTVRNVGDPHGCKLEKNNQGNWEITISGGTAVPYYYGKNNYCINHFRIDSPGHRTLIWSVGPTVATVDSSVFSGFDICDRPNVGAQGSNDIWHENSWDYLKWSSDSILVAVSERSVNDIVFYWLIDSAGTWIPQGIERLGNAGWRHNNFTFPHHDFTLNHGHDARILFRSGDTIIMSLFDNHTCDSSEFAKGMLIMVTLSGKTCTVLRSQTQHSLSNATGSCQLMNELPITSTHDPQLVHAPLCIYWGFGQNPNLPDSTIGALTGYAPAGDPSDTGFMDAGIYNEYGNCIAGVTNSIFGYGYPDIQKDGKPVIQNYQVYQTAGYYAMPIPESKIHCTDNGNGTVTLSTTLNSVVWTTGSHTSSITIDPRNWNSNETTRLYGVQGKTDATMMGVLYSWDTLTRTGCPTTAIKPVTTSPIRWYPNPTEGIVFLSESALYKIYDMQGRIIHQGVGTSIDIHDCTSGIYLLSLAQSEQDWHTYRVSKQ